MTPQIDRLGKTNTVLRVSTHIYGVFEEDRWENIHFSSKCRYVTPQIDCLGKRSTDLRVSTDILVVSKEIDRKNINF